MIIDAEDPYRRLEVIENKYMSLITPFHYQTKNNAELKFEEIK